MTKEKTEAQQLRSIAVKAFVASKDDFVNMITNAHDAIAEEFASADITIADGDGMTAEFGLTMETVLAWLWTEQFEVRLKDEFRIIKKYRGYP